MSPGFCECSGEMYEPLNPVDECSAENMGGPVVCCDDGDTCTCNRYYCDDRGGSSCLCTDVGVADPPATSCSGSICCASDSGLCTCGTIACSASETQVAACTADVARCDSNETRVEKCRRG
jgi:hypothetical protein